MNAPLPRPAQAGDRAATAPRSQPSPRADRSGRYAWVGTAGRQLACSPQVGRCLAIGGALSVLMLSWRLLGLPADLTLWQAGRGVLLAIGGILLVVPQWLGWPRRAAILCAAGMLLLMAIVEGLRVSIVPASSPVFGMLSSLFFPVLVGGAGLLLLPAFLRAYSSLANLLVALIGGLLLSGLGAAGVVDALKMGMDLWSGASGLAIALLTSLALWLGAVALAALEARLTYRWTARLLLWRSILLRAAGVFFGLVVAAQIYPTLYLAVWRLLFATPGEGLAGMLATLGSSLSGLLTAAFFLCLPRLLAQGQLAGRLSAGATGESVWFAVLALLPGCLPLLLDSRSSSDYEWASFEALGLSIVLTVVTHTLLRLLCGRPPLSPASHATGASRVALYIFLPEAKPTAASLTLAERALRSWQGGPATLVAPPSAVWWTAGPHLRLTQQAGLLPALFVERDWQMAHWQRLRLPAEIARPVLPLAELYGGRIAWQTVLAEAPEESRRLVIVGDSPLAWDAAFFAALPENSEIIVDSAASAPPPHHERARIAFADTVRCDEWLTDFRQRYTPPNRPPRRLLLLHAPHDAALAQRLAAALDGLHDRHEQCIVASALAVRMGPLGMLQLAGPSLLGVLDLFARFTARQSARQSGLSAWVFGTLAKRLLTASPARIDLLVVESGAATDGDTALARGLDSDADAVYSLLPADVAVSAPRLYEPAVYTAVWRLPPRSTLDEARTAELARLWLDGRWAPLSTEVTPNEPPAERNVPTEGSAVAAAPLANDAELTTAESASTISGMPEGEGGSGAETSSAKPSPPPSPVQVHVLYASQDQFEWQTLRAQLAPLVADGALVLRQEALTGGNDWAAENAAALAEAELVLLLLSPAFLDSSAGRIELELTLQRALSSQVHLLPILLRRCDWQSLPLARFAALPSDGVPVVESTLADQSFANIAAEIARLVHTLRETPAQIVNRLPSAAAKKSAKRKVPENLPPA